MADFVHPITLLSQARLPTRFGDFDVAVFEIDGTPGELSEALALIASADSGVLLYLRQEGRGIGLANKIRAYALQDQGLDTVDANLALGLPVDRREYASAAAILRELGLRQVRLLTNNPLKSAALERHGIQVVERVPLAVRPNSVNRRYLRTKADRMGHLLAL